MRIVDADPAVAGSDRGARPDSRSARGRFDTFYRQAAEFVHLVAGAPVAAEEMNLRHDFSRRC
jgi:hypothetical protein